MKNKTSKRTILHLANFPPPYGGVTVGNERLYNYMLKNNLDFKIFNISRKFENRKGVINISINIKSLTLCLLKTSEFFKFRKRIKRDYDLELSIIQLYKYYYIALAISNYLMIENKYTAYCNHLGKSQLVFVLLKLRNYNINICTYLHGAGIIEKYDNNPIVYRKLTNLSSTYMVASKYMKQLYEERKDKVNDVRIASPFIVEEYYKEDIDSKENIILFVGSFSNVKNPLYVIEELNKVKHLLSTYKVCFIGKGDLENDMRKKITDYNLPNIEIIGPLSIKNTEHYFEIAKFLVLPSIREPFGRVIIEAMSKRTIPIVSNIDGMPELITDKSGFVFNLKTGELANILNRLGDVDFKNMSLNSYNEALKYSENSMGSKWLKILLE